MLIAIAILLFLLLQGVPGLLGIISGPTTGGSTTLTTGAGAPPIHITLTPTTTTSRVERLSYVTPTPVAISFTANPSGTGSFSYLWSFGDGTSSTDPSVTHVFQTNCVYDLTLNVTNSMGPSSSGTVVISLFGYKRAGGEIVVCPQQGTAGITKVELGGGYYGSNVPLGTQVDNSSLASVTTDGNGDWALNVTGDLPPQVDGTLYNFTTSPYSVRGTFLTLEGIRVAPASGEPGASFTLEGRSYPAYTTVSISLGGVSLGTAQTDGSGTFLANMTVPYSFRYAGTYQFTTSPPVLGASAAFTIPVSTTTPAAPVPYSWWPWVLAALAVIAVLVGLFLWRRRPPVDLELFQEQVTGPSNAGWAIRVWGNRRLDRCRMTYDRTPLRTLVSPTDERPEMTLPKGESLVFRIPASLPIAWDALVVVQDGDKTVRTERLGSIERTNA